jgi:hypothetical protein
MFTPKENWEFNLLGIYNYTRPGPYELYFNNIRLRALLDPGDLMEVGIFNGRTLLATALLLQEIGSQKLVYGFDSFSGFPNSPSKLDELSLNKIHDELGLDFKVRSQRLLDVREFFTESKTNSHTISSSRDFSDSNLQLLNKKIEFLGLSNIRLVPGPFIDTMTKKNSISAGVFSGFLDCDLYDSYVISLNFIWPQLIRGGVLYADEYYSLKFPGARIAIDNFVKDKKVKKIKYSGDINDEFQRNLIIKL